jgi:simple sugar transport system permease protein
MELWIEFAAAAIRIATPLLIGALGAILSERGGTFAVSLEGQMLAGALAAVLASALAGPWAGVAAAMLAGLAVGALAALATGRFRADHMVAGIALNLLVLGLTSFLARLRTGGVPRLPLLASLGRDWLPVLLVHPPITWAGLALVPLLGLLLMHTAPGLALRAAGENPEAAIAAGLAPGRARAAGVLAGGALGGLAGAALALQQVGTFTDGMTAGRGFLALAAVIVGRWRPGATVIACLAFGAAEALQLRVAAFALPVSSYVVQMLPYVLALLVLAMLGRSSAMPRAIGRPLQP